MILPPLNDPATEFVVEQYYVDVDAPVVAGQTVALVRSEHFAWSIPATTSGIVLRLAAAEGSTVAVGAPLIEMRAQGTGHRAQELGAWEQRSTHPKPEARNPEPEPRNPEPDKRVRATPVARRVAASHDVDLATLSGTGRGSIITRADVLAALGHSTQHSALSTQHSALSTQHSVPTFQPSNLPYALTAIEVDLGAAQAFIAQNERRTRRGDTIGITACVAAAAVAALNEHRMLNSAWSDDGIIVRSRVHLLIEQFSGSGAHAALVTDAADLNPLGLARRLARNNKEQQLDHRGATFVIAHRSGPWWEHAQPNGTHSASLTVGEVRQQPRVVETPTGDTIMIRPVALLVLAYDARAVDQVLADAFLRTVGQRLEHLHRL